MKNINVKLLWYDHRDGNGIVEDAAGNEYYIDSSVLQFEQVLLSTYAGRGTSRTGLGLVVDLNTAIKTCLCGKNVRMA